MAIKDLKPNTNASLDDVTVIEKGPVREFSRGGQLGRVCSCKIKDATGTCEFSLFNDDVDKYEKGDRLKLIDCWVKEWNSNIQISPGRSGKIEKL